MEQFASGIDTDGLDISFERGNDPTRKNTNEQRPRPTTTSKSSTIMSAFDSLDKKSRAFRKSNLTTPQLVVTNVSQIVQRKTGDGKVNCELNIWPAVKKVPDETEQPLSSCLRRASVICSRPRKNFDFDSLVPLCKSLGWRPNLNPVRFLLFIDVRLYFKSSLTLALEFDSNEMHSSTIEV